jgi:hypothetical protein
VAKWILLLDTIYDLPQTAAFLGRKLCGLVAVQVVKVEEMNESSSILSWDIWNPNKYSICLFPVSGYEILESRRRRTKGSVVGEEWCQNAAPLR